MPPLASDMSRHRDLYEYWSTVRGERSAPTRSDIDPLAMTRFLTFIGLIERRSDRHFWRLMGSAIVEHFGHDYTGQRYGAHVSTFDSQGFDAGKKITGRKRHILVDTLGLLLNVVVHPANVQDRDGAGDLLRTARRSFPFIERIFADAGYQGPRVANVVARTGSWALQIVKRSDAHRFVVLPKRWIVERTFAWISRNRRLARDFERYSRTVAAFFRLAMIRIMLRRLTRPTHSA